MPSVQHFTFIAILFTLLISIVSANPTLVKEKERSQIGDVDQLLQLLDQIDPPALHAALHDFSPKKFKHGVFQEDRTAVKALHRVDAAAATNIISLAKRLGGADNNTSTGQQTPSSTINAPSTATVVATVSSPVSIETKSVASNVAPAPVGPATATSTSGPAGVIGSTTTVIASTPPTTVLVTSTLPPSSAGASSSPPAGSQSSSASAGAGGAPAPSGTSSQASSAAASRGSTQAASGGSSIAAGSVITSTNAAGVTMVSTVGGGAATLGSVVTSTDARGLTIVSTIGGGVVTIQPSGSQGASPSTAAGSASTTAPASQASSAAPQSSHTSVFLQTTTLPGGGQSTITAVTVVPGPPAATPSGTAGAKSGSSTTAAPGLQSGGAVASRMVGWEVAGLLGGAMGVAMAL